MAGAAPQRRLGYGRGSRAAAPERASTQSRFEPANRFMALEQGRDYTRDWHGGIEQTHQDPVSALNDEITHP